LLNILPVHILCGVTIAPSVSFCVGCDQDKLVVSHATAGIRRQSEVLLVLQMRSFLFLFPLLRIVFIVMGGKPQQVVQKKPAQEETEETSSQESAEED
ncbi:hypothetical protein STEG23_015827, partial [Scotinomys teguina]